MSLKDKPAEVIDLTLEDDDGENDADADDERALSGAEGPPDENSTKRRARKKTKTRKRNKSAKSKTEEIDAGKLFVMDSQPAELPSNLAFTAPAAAEDEKKSSLLLPEHVIVMDEGVEILRPPTPQETSDFEVEYLSFADDNTRGMLRYFAQEEAEKRKIVCKHCGAEGDHDTRSCTVKICLTCGARNEHSTAGCPVTKSCYSCGLHGHLASDCPNKYSIKPKFGGTCDRCKSRLHITQECPRMWRIYTYKKASERDETLKMRASLENNALGQGGEAYIARDEFCYHCGEAGHWGDSCDLNRKSKTTEPSAFGDENVLSGPFGDTQIDKPKVARPANHSAYADTREYSVGKAAKKKSIAAQRDYSRRQYDQTDEDDWFARQESRGKASSSKQPAPQRLPDIHIKASDLRIKGMSKQRDRDVDLPQPSRMAYDGPPHRGGSSDEEDGGGRRKARRARGKAGSSNRRDDYEMQAYEDSRQAYGDSRYGDSRQSKYSKPPSSSRNPPLSSRNPPPNSRSNGAPSSRNGPSNSRGPPSGRGYGQPAAGGSGSSNRPRYKGGYARD
ncbi:hypothetical protein EV122DRAFT_265148 [Schizophyllum commune]